MRNLLSSVAVAGLLAAAPPLPAGAITLVGQGGADGFVATGSDGAIHVVIGGRYRRGPTVEQLSPAEAITDLTPVNTVRMTIDPAGRPHVVFTTGATSKATRSYYTTRDGERWLPAEKFADAADFPERERAYVADVAVDARGNALVCFWVSRSDARRQERDNPSFHYRWRSPGGKWSEPRSLPAHWSSAPKVECAPGGGFHLLWQSQGRDWRIAGPVAAGGTFTEAQSIATGSAGLEGLSTQNEGCDFTIAADGSFVVAGNVREKFEGPVGVWAAAGRGDAPLKATFLGGFRGTKRGDESALHPVATIDAATGTAFVTMINPADRRAFFAVRLPAGEWQRAYVPLLPEHSAPQGTLRQGPSVADVPGPGVVALVRDREEHWYLRKLDAPVAGKLTRWDALGEIEDLGAGITPGVAVSPDGTTHVISMRDGRIFHHQRGQRGRFGPPESIPVPSEVAPADSVFNSPHVVCDRSGTLHLAFTNGFTGSARKAWYTNRQGGTWKTPVIAIDHTETGRRTNYPRLATDGTTAWIGAFAGGGSTVVKLVDLATTPRVAAKTDTPLWVAHPLVGPKGEIFVVGRRGAAGHHFETYSADLVASGSSVLLSRGTPTKTFEPTTALIDSAGVIHAAGAAGSPNNLLWHTTSVRAAAGQDVILGPELGTGIKEYTFPTMIRDARGRVYVSYRRHPAGDGQVTALDEPSGRFEEPVTFAPVINQRLRWNAPLAAAPGGGVYAVWEAERRILFRAIGEASETGGRAADDRPVDGKSRKLTANEREPANAGAARPRLLVLTDIGGDPDDTQSMVRLMVYANAFEIEGLVATSAGIPGQLKVPVTRPEIIREVVRAYGQVRSNLVKHGSGWPQTDDLLRAVKTGNPRRGRDFIGEQHDTEGSRWIIARVDAGASARPLNITIWGGQTDFAQALWRVKQERGAKGLAEFVERVRVYDIGDQDKIADWIREEFPGLFYILSSVPPGADRRRATFRGMYLGGDESLTSQEWVAKNVLSRGPLGALYPTKTSTKPNPHGCLKEGDTPAWFFFLPGGGNHPADPSQPGWGGQFRKADDGWWRDLPFTDNVDPRETVSRWRPQFQADFARRMAWCVGE